MKRISLKEVAAASGVSASTVSLILNGKARKMRISETLEKKVIQTARKMGYQPNQLAVSLRTGKSNILGLVVESISGRFFASLAKVIEDEAEKHGYRVVYCSTENDPRKGSELLKMLSQRQVDGYLITPTQGMEGDIKSLARNKMPLVLIDSYFPDVDVPYVSVNNYEGTETGIRYLVEKGYKRIGFVTVDLPLVQIRDRERAFKEVMKQSGIRVGEKAILRVAYDLPKEKTIAQIGEFLIGSFQPEAVFFATNYLGVAGMESIRQLQLSIPKDMAVVCFDDEDLFRLLPPGITSVQQPVEQIAAKAIELLMYQIHNKKITAKERRVQLSPRLIIRGSAR